LNDTYLIPRKLELSLTSKELEDIAWRSKITDKSFLDKNVNYKGYREGKCIILTSKLSSEPGQQKVLDEVFYNPTEVIFILDFVW